MSAIKATFSDFKLVKTRKVAQLVMEVPIEQADAAVKALGGLPTFAEEQWVGIAPLKSEAASKPAPKQSDRWEDLPAVKQAAIRCQDEGFQRWIAPEGKEPTADLAAQMVRYFCGVDTRSDIKPENPEAVKTWQNIDAEYRSHAGLR